ncbi:hypothetical protein [Belnapia rosea]|uniref:Lipoprotein n=1 Tax=Belnapia rosea TaxID=938405 RepID=A0A1G6JSK3_9PROT|nr:hypothetical protein [Belnapia rosea]SDB13858.1 hypothetical protein SAMN02927895_00447 [Belnapia rosea]SDC21621.1 hypothetical protein SAMN04487779_1001262 [Belnapia rosea]
MTSLLRIATLALAPLALAACMVRVPVSEQPAAYSQAPAYAAPLPSSGYVAAPAVDSYCAEAVGEAQDAAAVAAATGRGRDANRARRAEGYARRDCR